MTAQADAFRSGEDLLTLAPGDDVAASWGIRAL
jgi:aldose 1-epimerase